MKLIVGGAFQGKRAAAQRITGIPLSEFLDGALCPMEAIEQGKAMYHFQEYLRRMMQEKLSTEGFVEALFLKNPDIVLVSTELGYGIVPMDPFEREYRERVGRICCEAAERSTEVYRVVAGIPTKIKGEET